MEKATLAIDGHVHLYNIYDLVKAVKKGTENLIGHAKTYVSNSGDIIPVWLLVERSDSNIFNQIYRTPEKFGNNKVNFKRGKDKYTIVVENDSHPILYIFTGRQFVTKEALEVLSLISDLNIADRQKQISEVIEDVKKSGGIPTLNWAPGKWFFARGKAVARQINHNSADDFFIGETTLRHTFWPEPKLFKQAKKRGFSIIAGSDPLPFKGEENRIGSFGFLNKGEFDLENPAQSLRDLMKINRKGIQIIGKRNDVFTFSKRQYKIMMEKKNRG